MRLEKKYKDYRGKPSASEILQEDGIRQLFAKYFAGRTVDAREAISAGAIFIDRLFEHEKVLSSNDRNKVLDDLEAEFIEKFAKAFKKYLRLDIIPKELVEVLREALLDIRSRLYNPKASPFRAGRRSGWYSES
ncbi:MAG: hypothetical protein QXM43_00475 [Desulfurococcaceae archaeon]